MLKLVALCSNQVFFIRKKRHFHVDAIQDNPSMGHQIRAALITHKLIYNLHTSDAYSANKAKEIGRHDLKMKSL